MNLTGDSLEQSRAAVNRIGAFARRLAEAGTGTQAMIELAEHAENSFREAMFDDLNAPEAMAALFSFISDVNRELDSVSANPALGNTTALERARDAFRLMDGVLDLVPETGADDELGAWVEQKLADRRAARERRDFAAADAIREELTARNILIEDGPTGTRWRKG